MPEPSEQDIRDADPSALVKMAAAVQALAGLFVGLTGLQLVGTRWVAGWPDYAPYVLLALGASHVFLGATVFRARNWAAVTSAGLGVVTALVMIGWLFYVFTTIMSCILYVAVPFAVLNAILSFVALSGVRTTAEARRRLAEQGMNLGL